MDNAALSARFKVIYYTFLAVGIVALAVFGFRYFGPATAPWWFIPLSIVYLMAGIAIERMRLRRLGKL
jgi:hypothetical protein